MVSRVESAEEKEEGSMIDSEGKEKPMRNARALSLIILIVLIIEQLLPFLLRACSLTSTLGTEGHSIHLKHCN